MKMKSDCQSKDPQSNNPSKVKLNSSTSSDVNLSQKFISFSKGLREKSVGSQLARKDSDLLLQQKIQLQKTENGFIIDKKYLIFQIQCFLVSKVPNNRISPITLNIDSHFIIVNKNGVNHSFHLEKGSKAYLQISSESYKIQAIAIPNRRIQYTNNQQNEENADIVHPLKMIEESEQIRKYKIFSQSCKITNFLWKNQRPSSILRRKQSNASEMLNESKAYQNNGKQKKTYDVLYVANVGKNKENCQLNKDFDQAYDEYFGKKIINVKKKSKISQQQSFEMKNSDPPQIR